MKAFNNDQKIKDKYLKRVSAHYKADEIIKGQYWEKGKGCAVGCTIHSPDHHKYETELGIPSWLAMLEDRIFEGLPNETAKEFPLKFLQSIDVGVDLNKIKTPFLIFVLESTLDTFDHKKYPQVKHCIEKVIELYRDPSASLEDARNARAAATISYAAAAHAAAHAAYAAIHAAAAHAATAASAADAAGAKRNAYITFADKLIELLSECK